MIRMRLFKYYLYSNSNSKYGNSTWNLHNLIASAVILESRLWGTLAATFEVPILKCITVENNVTVKLFWIHRCVCKFLNRMIET